MPLLVMTRSSVCRLADSRSRELFMNWRLSMNCTTYTKCHVFLHVVCNAADFMIFNCFRHSKSGHDQVTIITSEVVEDHRDFCLFWVFARLEVECIVGSTSLLTSNVTVVWDTIID